MYPKQHKWKIKIGNSHIFKGLYYKIFENHIQFDWDIQLSNMSIFAQPVMKLFSCMLSQWWNMFRICSASDGIRSTYAQHILNDDFEMGWGFKVWKSINKTQKDFFLNFFNEFEISIKFCVFYTFFDFLQKKIFNVILVLGDFKLWSQTSKKLLQK
jgi:hypothetical protein